MDFRQLHSRLTGALRRRIQNGEFSERSLARIAGISQPHLHNVLKDKRLLSLDMAGRVLEQLHMDLLDLLDEEDIERWRLRRGYSSTPPERGMLET